VDTFFLETENFTDWVAEHPPEWDSTYAQLQKALQENPECGKVMKDCGGLRKVRMADLKRGKGKRGGARIIYLHIPEAHCVCMIDGYGKNEKEDLSAAQREVLSRIAEAAKEMVLRTHGITSSEEDVE
jgi:hypothetical protein